ncbi:ribosome modulation factor [Thalassotalea piscium]
MRRQKRDRLDRAYSNGYQAGLCGRNKENCPYQNINAKSEWLGGWREAVSYRQAGLFK